MRFVHTSDWHLGRLFHGHSLIEDQAHVLEQFVAIVREAKADAVIVAGDVYDRSVPGSDAVRLLDDVLARVVAGLSVPVIMIAGNHDSPDRLAFGSRLLQQAGLHVFGLPSAEPSVVRLADVHGTVAFCALPYAEPARVREATGEEVPDHEAALRLLAGRARALVASERRTVAVAHAFVVGGEESESERPLTMGGSGTVPAECFDGFSYAALGHLHRPQRAGSDRVRYCGSLLAQSSGEALQEKGVLVVDLDAEGGVTVETVALVPRREVRVLRGAFAELMKDPTPGQNREDWIFVRLTDREAILDPTSRLREFYPNIVDLRRADREAAALDAPTTSDPRSRSERDLFADFFRDVTGDGPTEEEARAFDLVATQALQAERDAPA